MPDTTLTEPIAEQVWRSKYRLRQNGHATEPNLHASRSRIALALAHVEAHDRNDWRMRFESILAHHRFLPGGRIWAGAQCTTPSTASLVRSPKPC
jgi:ribonucleoside-diphosphate reductase alpha chain